MDLEKVNEARTRLDLAVSEALKTYSMAEVKKSIENQIWKYQMMQVTSVKGVAFKGVPNWDDLQICIDLLRSKLSELGDTKAKATNNAIGVTAIASLFAWFIIEALKRWVVL